MDNRYWSKYLYPIKPQPTELVARGKSDLTFSAILFDIYGTLLISASGDKDQSFVSRQQHKRLAKLLQRYQINGSVTNLQNRLHAAIKSSHFRSKQNGIDFPEIDIRSIWSELLQGTEIPSLRRFAIEYELFANPVYPMPGLKHLLHVCRQRHILMGIISNAQFFTPLLLEWLLGATLKDAGFNSNLLHFSYRMGRAKPSPLIFEQVAAQLTAMGKSSDTVLYVGNDMRNDITPASRVGFRTAIFAGDRRSLRLRSDDPLCRGIQPDIVLTHLNEILKYI